MSAGEEGWPVHPHALEQGRLIDSWRVVERLGAGGYGAVYKVEHVAQPGTWYALKLALQPGDKRTEREELLLMGQAAHPNVVRLHASGRWPHPVDGHPYFVMSWVDGRALHTWAETLNPTFRQLAEKAGKVALALGALHERGVLHRDLKPEHVLIRESDGEPILIDLGVGSFVGADTLTFSALPPATPHLLSPEAVRFLRRQHLPPGARYASKPGDDLHALGVVLYRVVTGHYPYSPELPLDMLYAAIEGGVPPEPVAFNRRVPRALSDLLMRLLASSPLERFQTGQELHAALVAAVAFEQAATWDASLFEWEEVPPQAEPGQGAPGRRIRRPQWPTEDSAPPPRPRLLRAWRPASKARARPPQARPDRVRAAQEPRPRGSAWPYLVLVAVLGAGLVGAKVLGGWPLAPSAEAVAEPPRAAKANLPAESPGQEVARQVGLPQNASTAAPPQAASTSAVVAAATHAKDETPVKKKMAARPSTITPRKEASKLGSVGKTLCTGAMSASLACAAPAAQVARLPPPPEPCPPGAQEAMERLKITRLSFGTGTFHDMPVPEQTFTVTEGPVRFRFMNGLGDLPQYSILTGRLVFGPERVQGRMTRAISPDGRIDIPVCLVVNNFNNDGGLVPVAFGPGPNTATVPAYASIFMAKEFK